jgi:hypothetical protein
MASESPNQFSCRLSAKFTVENSAMIQPRLKLRGEVSMTKAGFLSSESHKSTCTLCRGPDSLKPSRRNGSSRPDCPTGTLASNQNSTVYLLSFCGRQLVTALSSRSCRDGYTIKCFVRIMLSIESPHSNVVAPECLPRFQPWQTYKDAGLESLRLVPAPWTSLRLCSVGYHDPGGSVVTRSFPAADFAIDARADQTCGRRWAQKQMIYA